MIGFRRRKKQPVAAERRSETPEASTGQIIWLIATIAVTAAPHAPHVHPWVSLVVIAILTWRLMAALQRGPLPRPWLRVTLTLLGFAGVLVSYQKLSGLSAGAALLLVMAAMKLLETRGHRDRAIVIFICYFLLFATFLREQEIWSLAWLIVGAVVATAALFQVARTGRAVPIRIAFTQATRLLLQALPIALLLFLLFPRIPGPFWSLPHAGDQAASGLSGELSPGDIGELALSDEVAFRVRFEGTAPNTADMYWRGPVMSRFDGRRWTERRTTPRPRAAGAAQPDATAITYDLTLEPHGNQWLLALETPIRWDLPGAGLSGTDQLLAARAIDRRLSWRGTSTLGGPRPRYEQPEALGAARQVPVINNPRSAELGRTLRRAAGSDAAFLDALLTWFAGRDFAYTLRPPTLGANPVDEFLFETRRGFCGHYASAFALLARAGGIPARVVTGYQGGEKNPLGDYWIVRQSDAHAWVEAWTDGRWVRFDPTAMVAPDRIEYGFSEAMGRRDEITRDLLARNPTLIRLAMGWDALNAGWNRWVLGFGPEAQSALLRFFGFRQPAIEHLVITMSVLATLLLLLIGFMQRHRARVKPDSLTAAYHRLCRRIGAAARARRPSEGPREYLAACCEERPDLAADLQRLFGQYISLRYDGTGNAQACKKFIDGVRAFRPQRRRPPEPAPGR